MCARKFASGVLTRLLSLDLGQSRNKVVRELRVAAGAFLQTLQHVPWQLLIAAYTNVTPPLLA